MVKKSARFMSPLEFQFLLRVKAAGLPAPEKEYKFHSERKWRFDFAYPAQKIAVEVEGGTWIQGRHNRGAGYILDCEKYNAAAQLGWRVFRYPSGLFGRIPGDLSTALGIPLKKQDTIKR